jgi:hypothetical protein
MSATTPNLYCDLAINGAVIWTGRLCLNLNCLNWYPHQGFVGQLMFIDTQGDSDPTYDGLGTRYQLAYYPTSSLALGVSVPISAVPSQQFDIALGEQYCTISIYVKP